MRHDISELWGHTLEVPLVTLVYHGTLSDRAIIDEKTWTEFEAAAKNAKSDLDREMREVAKCLAAKKTTPAPGVAVSELARQCHLLMYTSAMI